MFFLLRRGFLALLSPPATSLSELRSHRSAWAWLGLVFLAILFLPAQAGAEEDAQVVLAALVRRVTPEFADRVHFEVLATQSHPVIRGQGQGICICASGVRECARAYGYYLRTLALVHLSWNGDNRSAARFVIPQTPVDVPETLPLNFAFNYTALSYTGTHWSQETWMKQIDRLALNGFRYVLVTSGMEEVWRGFLTDIGAASSASSFIANPCYAAWWHMGNLEGEGGPVSASLIAKEAGLGRAIVARLRELGMEPVLQGYVGFVPHDFTRFPDYLLPQEQWVMYYTRPTVLRPDAPAFPSLAAAWYKNLERVYGFRARAFCGDLFHESDIPEGVDLTACARAVQRAMQCYSPGATWFVQAWAGNPAPELLEGTQPEHTVILSLEKDLSTGLPTARNFCGRRYVWCELANFGGKQGLFGGFGVLEKASGNADGASGFGLLSEGLETNPIYYELFYERVNNRAVIDRHVFLSRTVLSRYGSKDARLVQALNLLANSVYSPDGEREGGPENILCARPCLDAQQVSTWSCSDVFYDPRDISRAGSLMLAAAEDEPSLLENSCFRYDLVDVCRQVLAERARVLLPLCKAAQGDPAAYAARAADFMALFPLLADVLATHEDFLLGAFLQGAAAREADSPGEMTRNLRRLITTWTPDVSPLSDYAHRQFSEMVRYYYMPRWAAFFRRGTEGAQQTVRETVVTNNGEHIVVRLSDDAELQAFERSFPTSRLPLLLKPTGDLISLARKILRPPHKP